MRMLIKRDKARGHEEMALYIDWGALTDADIKMLAGYYIHHRVEHEYKGWEEKLPEAVTVFAGDFMNRDSYVPKKLNVPNSWKAPPKSKARKELEKLCGDLTPEEIAALFA